MTTRAEMAQVMDDVFAVVREKVDGNLAVATGLSYQFMGLRDHLGYLHDWICGNDRVDAESYARSAIESLMYLHALADNPELADSPVLEDGVALAKLVSVALKGVIEKCQFFREAGQKEYANDDDNAFANFERNASYLAKMGITREAVICVYLEKHLDGIKSWIDGHKSQRESVYGRICDAIVYLCLLIGMIRSQPSE